MHSVAKREDRVAPEKADFRPALPSRPIVGDLSEDRMALTWSEQYRHPLWQKKRMEALAAAEFTCQHCCDTETQLHVHHKRYVKGRMVWEYGVGELEVLCEPCHEEAHAMKDALFDVLGSVHPMMGPWREAAAVMAGYYSAVKSVEERIDLQLMFDGAPLQFTVGVVASVIQWGSGGEISGNIAKAVSDTKAQPQQWEWIRKGFEFLDRIERQRIIDEQRNGQQP